VSQTPGRFLTGSAAAGYQRSYSCDIFNTLRGSSAPLAFVFLPAFNRSEQLH
jgi:hypothetical protein